MNLFLDYETRSVVDLLKVGLYNYADHPTTEILLMSWAIDNGPVSTWYRGTPLPAEFLAAYSDPSVRKVAHNAGFERIMGSRPPGRAVGLPAVPLAEWDCTAARAACMGLPRSLEGVGAAMGFTVQKDKEGHALMLRMCKPIKRRLRKGEVRDLNAPPEWLEDDASMKRLGAYCETDVLATRPIHAALPDLPPTERELWELTEEMNDRGILVDEKLLVAALLLIEDAEAKINRDIFRATNGQVDAVTNHSAITKWLLGLDLDDAFDENDDTPILGSEGVSKPALAAMLERTDLPDFVRNVLIMRQEGGKSSAAKYESMLTRMSADSRVRGSLLYCGAEATSRWCLAEGSLVLTKNRRGSVEEKPIEAVLHDDLVWDGDEWVSHEGVVYTGLKDVITHDGVTATADHIVYCGDTDCMQLSEASALGRSLFKGTQRP